MSVENAICPFCGREVKVTVPSNSILIRVVRNPNFAGTYISKRCATQWSYCIYCKKSFGAVTQFGYNIYKDEPPYNM